MSTPELVTTAQEAGAALMATPTMPIAAVVEHALAVATPQQTTAVTDRRRREPMTVLEFSAEVTPLLTSALGGSYLWGVFYSRHVVDVASAKFLGINPDMADRYAALMNNNLALDNFGMLVSGTVAVTSLIAFGLKTNRHAPIPRVKTEPEIPESVIDEASKDITDVAYTLTKKTVT